MKITDEQLEQYWGNLGSICVDDDGILEEPFSIPEQNIAWSEGTDREEIWHWFDEYHSIGVYKLMTND